ALLKPFEPLRLSAKSSAEPLVRRLEAIMDGANRSEELMLISSRQIDAVSKALREIEEASAPLQTQELELFSFHLNRALHVMASITRPFENDEMLDRMFGSFCLGK
ncbi:MAG: tRNA uridine-5-carboxymethylaminomethyl(34) synthesis GTPase MnmE, partial [Campylobacterales bacterium]|nr:tRNA uridine-5-carboxymethylaminomethyl(34) synthesis GTPase MnmE [Campylobacterales bacterium]